MWWTRHRGPYSFHVTRPFATKPGFARGEWLKGTVEAEEAEAEAQALLTDPRDRITAVHLWSEREQQFVMGWTTGSTSSKRKVA